jgi:oligogalacturonide lyase
MMIHCLMLSAWWGSLAATGAVAGQAGRDWGCEFESYVDGVTGVTIQELSRGPGANDNLYFHFSNFTADNRFLIFTSDRTGVRLLFRAEVESGRVVQLTEDPALNAPSACPDPRHAERLYCLRGPAVMALDIHDFSLRKVGEIPPPYVGGFPQPTVSRDGEWLALGKQRDETTWEIGRMRLATGAYQTVLTQGFRIGHVQYNPQDDWIFYVWETGGYAPQRSWLVRGDGTGNRPFYARTDPKTWLTPLKEWVTHEAWIAGTGAMTMVNDKVGLLVVSPGGDSRLVCEGSFWHAAARPDGQLLVADDAQGRLWLVHAGTGSKRLLATGLRDGVRAIHAHPSFDRRGHFVQFHTGRTRETVAVIDLRTLKEPVGRLEK